MSAIGGDRIGADISYAPPLPGEVVGRTGPKSREAYRRMTGEEFPRAKDYVTYCGLL